MKYDILPLRIAFLWIFAATIIVSGSTALSLWLYKWYEKHSASDDRYIITTLVQQTAGEKRVSSSVLEQLLGLSKDWPMYLTSYNTELATQKLQNFPPIKKALVKKLSPSTLLVDYTLRTPVALLSEFDRVVIDDKGISFPHSRASKRSRLPEIILGDMDTSFSWGTRVPSENLDVALDVLNALQEIFLKESFLIKTVDVSRIKAPSSGQREILVSLIDSATKDTESITYLRLGIEHYKKDLQNFWFLNRHMKLNRQNFTHSKTLVDLRVPQLAFLSSVQ